VSLNVWPPPHADVLEVSSIVPPLRDEIPRTSA